MASNGRGTVALGNPGFWESAFNILSGGGFVDDDRPFRGYPFHAQRRDIERIGRDMEKAVHGWRAGNGEYAE